MSLPPSRSVFARFPPFTCPPPNHFTGSSSRFEDIRWSSRFIVYVRVYSPRARLYANLTQVWRLGGGDGWALGWGWGLERQRNHPDELPPRHSGPWCGLAASGVAGTKRACVSPENCGPLRSRTIYDGALVFSWRYTDVGDARVIQM